MFRRKGKLYLVFEHVDHTILEDLDNNPNGLKDDRESDTVRKCMWQLLKAMDFLHAHNVMDINSGNSQGYQTRKHFGVSPWGCQTV